MNETQLSRSAYERLSAELEQLTTVGRTQIAQAIEAARALGDLSENGDYQAAKDEQGKMETRIRQLQAMLKAATIVDDVAATSGDKVTVGCVVTLDFGFGEERYLVGSIEERPTDVDGVISPDSHLGQQLLSGASPITTPNGDEVKLVSIG